MLPGSLRGVLFDWDGTLLNSAEASYRCYVRLFASFDISYDRKRFEETYAPNWYYTYEKVGLAERHWNEADARWLRFYAEERSELLPGARAALTRVSERRLLQGLVTSGDCERVARELTALDLDRFFRAVVCGDHTPLRKPHPDPLLLALRRLDVVPDAAAYVGDSPEDVEMARAAGVYSVGIPGGFPNRAALEASKPDLLVGSLEDAVTALFGD